MKCNAGFAFTCYMPHWLLKWENCLAFHAAGSSGTSQSNRLTDHLPDLVTVCFYNFKCG